MDREQLLEVTFGGSYDASFNQRYHTKLSRLWAICDKGTRIAVGILATLSFGLAYAGSNTSMAIWLAFLSALTAILVNVIPFGEWEKTHRDLFRRWTDLRQRWEALEIKTERLPQEKVPDHLLDLIEELNATSHRIEGGEPAPIKWLLERCQDEENLSRYDEKNPSDTDILKRRKKRARQLATSSS